MARVPLRTRLVLLLAAALAGCGKPASPSSAEPWPISLQSNVVDYAAVRLPDEIRDELARGLFGFAPSGLDSGRSLIGLWLDAKAFGASNALLLPLRDESAFRASLDAAPVLQRGARDAYTLDVEPDSPLGRLRLIATSVGTVQTLPDMLRALEQAGTQTIAFQVTVVDDWAILAPTFEAASACRQMLRETGGFVSAPPLDLVVSFDVARFRVVCAEELQRLEDQFKGLIGGVQVAGLAGVVAAMHEGEAAELPFGVRWEFVWALKEMFPLAALEGVQIQVGQLGDGSAPAQLLDNADEGRILEWLLGSRGDSLRLRLAPGTPQAGIVAALRPAPDVPDALLVVAADGPAFGRAVARWIRPLGRLVTGDGPPCDRYLEELSTLLASAGGVFALVDVEGEPCLLATAGEAPADLLPRLQAWVGKLLATAGVDVVGGEGAALGTRELANGRTQLVGANGEAIAVLGRRDDVFWLRAGAEAVEPSVALGAFQRALSAPAPADAPALRWRSEAIEIDVRVADRELQLDVRRVGDDR